MRFLLAALLWMSAAGLQAGDRIWSALVLANNEKPAREVPANLYVAVAQVLTYVYQLKAARQSGAVPPTPPTIDASIEETKH